MVVVCLLVRLAPYVRQYGNNQLLWGQPIFDAMRPCMQLWMLCKDNVGCKGTTQKSGTGMGACSAACLWLQMCLYDACVRQLTFVAVMCGVCGIAWLVTGRPWQSLSFSILHKLAAFIISAPSDVLQQELGQRPLPYAWWRALSRSKTRQETSLVLVVYKQVILNSCRTTLPCRMQRRAWAIFTGVAGYWVWTLCSTSWH